MPTTDDVVVGLMPTTDEVFLRGAQTESMTMFIVDRLLLRPLFSFESGVKVKCILSTAGRSFVFGFYSETISRLDLSFFHTASRPPRTQTI